MPGSFDVNFMSAQTTEHNAWLDVVAELRERGVDDINADEKDEELHDAIVRWAEELVQLRMLDPDDNHAFRALRERREKYPGRPEGVKRPKVKEPA